MEPLGNGEAVLDGGAYVLREVADLGFVAPEDGAGIENEFLVGEAGVLMTANRLFSRTARGSVSSIGERALIGSIRRWLGPASPRAPAGIGDDCAVLPPPRGRELLTVDPVAYGIHFDDRIPARAAGAKLLKRNLSDIAAMGGRPRAAVVALALDGRVSIEWLAEFYRGLARESRLRGVPVVGGDVTLLPGSFVATLALTGEATGRILTRTGSRAGDWIYVTCAVGRSVRTRHHYLFEPRLAEGAWLARRKGGRAMIDVSDGLAKRSEERRVGKEATMRWAARR